VVVPWGFGPSRVAVLSVTAAAHACATRRRLVGVSLGGGIASGGNVSWTPASAADGLDYWKVTATDSVGNASSTTGSFTLGTVAPAKPALGSRRMRSASTARRR
jgi:hypothetical protein